MECFQDLGSGLTIECVGMKLNWMTFFTLASSCDMVFVCEKMSETATPVPNTTKKGFHTLKIPQGLCIQTIIEEAARSHLSASQVL